MDANSGEAHEAPSRAVLGDLGPPAASGWIVSYFRDEIAPPVQRRSGTRISCRAKRPSHQSR